MKKDIDLCADVYLNEKFYEFRTMSRGLMGYGEPSVAPRYLSPDADNALLGATLRLALSFSKKVSSQEFLEIFHSGIVQERAAENAKQAMNNYGYRNKRAMYKNMLCCGVSVFDGEIEIKPTHHKSLDSYSGISNDGPEIQNLSMTVSDAELGAALREGFKRCTSAVG